MSNRLHRTMRDARVRNFRAGRRLSVAALAVFAGVLALVLGPASPAQAHAALVSSSPTGNAIVQDAPTQVVLTFTEHVNPVTGKVHVIAPDGTRIDEDNASSSGDQLVIPLRPVTATGTYLVTYRVISADSHPVGGAFSWSYKVASPNGPPADSAGTGAGASGFVLTALPIARWIGFVGLMLLVGAGLVLTLLWPRRLKRSAPMRAAMVGAGLVALATVLELALDVPYVAGGGLGSVRGSDVQEVLASQYGAAHLVRLGVLGAAVVLLRAVVKGRGWGADRVLLAVLGVIGVATWSLSGHPSASTVPSVSVTADMIHLASMSVWLGGLAMLVVFLLPRANATELAAIVPLWSRWATYAVGALVVTGVVQGLFEVRTFSALFGTTYGLVLVAKVALVGVVLLVALGSRRLVAVLATGADEGPADDGARGKQSGDSGRPVDAGQGGARPAARRLRQLVLVEALVALTIIGITSVLVQLTPASTAEATQGSQPSVQSASLTDPHFTLTVDLTPAQVGVNELHLYASTPDGLAVSIVEWNVTASNKAAGVDNIAAVVTSVTPDHAIGQIGLPSAGLWHFTFTLRLDATTDGIVVADLTVSG
jgi:copper transport protein